MASDEDKQGVPGPPEEDRPSEEPVSESAKDSEAPSSPAPEGEGDIDPSHGEDYDDPYGEYEEATSASVDEQAGKDLAVTTTLEGEKEAASGGDEPPPSPPSGEEEEEEDDEEEDGMLRMSFMEHLEELRRIIIRSLMGIGVAFFVSIVFANRLWLIVSEPAMAALRSLGIDPPQLVQIKPMETFTTVWVKLPILTAIFLASPWVLYQIWSFIAPGLYKRERRWAVPFVVCSAGLFITGGLFAYFVAFRFGLTFLLGIGRDINIAPMVSITEYFDLFVNVTLGIGLVFELPVLIFFLTLLRIVTPRFLVRNSRYAVLIIVIVAAIITPTPDVVNLMLFSVPMVLLYFVGIFAGYLLNIHRDDERFPWGIVILILAALLVIVTVAGYFAMTRYGYHIQDSWPYLTQ